MITSKEKEKLKEILGNNYVPLVKLKLNDKGVVNPRTKKPYSDSSIKGTLNGDQDNANIIEALYEVYYEKKKQLERIEEMRNALLKGNFTAKIQSSTNA